MVATCAESTHTVPTIALQSCLQRTEAQRLHTGWLTLEIQIVAMVGLVSSYFAPLGGIYTEASYTAYSTDGMLADHVRIEELATFDIDLEGFSETTVVVAKDLSLAGRYEPLRFTNFPLDDVGGELSMVTYWSGEKEDFPFPVARQRTCEIGAENPGWGKFGVGFYLLPKSAYGSCIFSPKVTAGQSAFRRRANEALFFVEGISDGLCQFVRVLTGQGQTLPVEARASLPVTWGALKQQR